MEAFLVSWESGIKFLTRTTIYVTPGSCPYAVANCNRLAILGGPSGHSF
jgi:hypothetical protein